MRNRIATITLLLHCLASIATGGEPAVAQAPDQSDVPKFMQARKQIPEDLLERKKEGKYWLGFPIIGYDPDTLLTIGATVNWFDDGPRDSPFFRYNSYDRKTSLAAAYATGGMSTIRFNFDAPNFNGTPFHINTGVTYLKNDYVNYFGVGERTLAPLSYPGSTRTYGSYESYLDALAQIDDGKTYTYYDTYQQQQIVANFDLQRDMLGGVLRPVAGIQIAYYDIGDYTGDTYDGAKIQSTHLRDDQDAGRITGFNGGWDNALKLGVTYDTRDFAPNPSNGVFLQAIGRMSLKALGSIENYGQLKLEGRGYYSPFPETTRLVLAGRVGYLAQTSNTPFFVLSQAPNADSSSSWLGGFDSLRGYQDNRFVGENVAVASAAARWFFAESTLWNQNLGFGVTTFVDSGSVFDSIGATSFRDWKVSGGVGFLLTWNVSTVVSFDLGVSEEGSNFYMGLGMPF